MAGVVWAWCCPWSRVTREGVCIISKFISGRKWGTSVVCSYQVTGRHRQHVLHLGEPIAAFCVCDHPKMKASVFVKLVFGGCRYVICG